MDTTTAGQHHRAFTCHQTFRAFLGITESHTCTGNQVKVVFQLRWDVEVVHRRGDNNHIMRFQLSNQLIGQRQRFLLTRRQRCIARAHRTHQFAIQYRYRICSQVADSDFISRVLFTPLFNKIIRQLTRLRVPCQNTGFKN